MSIARKSQNHKEGSASSWKRKYRIGLTALLFLFQVIGFAQTPEQIKLEKAEKAEKDTTKRVEFLKDTSVLTYFYGMNPGQEYTFADTLLSQIHVINPVRLQHIDQANLGNVGTATTALFYASKFRRGVFVGMEQYDIYKLDTDSLRYFNSLSGISQVSFSSGNQQADGYFQGFFSRDFKNGINLALDAKRIFQQGESYHFQHQQSKQLAFTLGLSYVPEKSFYSANLAYGNWAADLEDNGGVLPDTIGVDRPFEYDVNTTNAYTRNSERTFDFKHELSFNAKNSGRSFVLGHNLNYTNENYKFYNTSVADTLYYAQYGVEDYRVRHFLQKESIENTVSLKTYKVAKDDLNKKSQLDYFEVGAIQTYHIINQEPDKFYRNNLFLFGKWNLQIKKFITLATYAHYGLWDNANDFRLQGDVTLNLKKLGKLEGSFVNQIYKPSLTDNRYLISQELLWENNFDKLVETEVSVEYVLPKWGTSLGGKYSLINNLIYYDTLSRPIQTGIPVSIAQFSAYQPIVLGAFHWDNLVVLQQMSEDYLRLPKLFVKSSIYAQGKLFKKALFLKSGFDIRIYNGFRANTYAPLTGRFHQQESIFNKSYPAIDFFISSKVQSFRGFFKLENLAGLFSVEDLDDLFGQRYFFQTANYPYPYYDLMFRWGITWNLRG